MHTAFSFTTLSASGTRFRMLPKACGKTAGAVLSGGFYEDPKAAAVLKKPKCFTFLWKVPSRAATMTVFPALAIISQKSTMSGN